MSVVAAYTGAAYLNLKKRIERPTISDIGPLAWVGNLKKRIESLYLQEAVELLWQAENLKKRIESTSAGLFLTSSMAARISSRLLSFNLCGGKLSAVGVLYVDASSPEEFVSRVVGLGEFGLDTAAGEVLVRPYDGRRVCRGRPTTPVAVYQRPRTWPRAGGSVLGKGVY